MSRISDNGLHVWFPDDNVTKPDEHEIYTPYSSLFTGFKCVDGSWFDRETSTLWLVELKRFYDPENARYQEPDLSNKGIRNEKIGELLQKSVAVLLLFNDRHQTVDIFPEGAAAAVKIEIVHLLSLPEKYRVYFTSLTDDLRRRFKPFALNAQVTILDYHTQYGFLPFRTGENPEFQIINA